MMNILLTNDDGINALGIKKVEQILKNYGNVFVVAPKVEQSGKACSINAFKSIRINKIDSNHIAVEGSPVDCVEVALAMLDVDFDLIVSGCNNGYNLAHDVMYSGTCGACVQALFAKKKAIALSIRHNSDFEVLDVFLNDTLKYIFDNDLLSTNYFLNVNFPDDINYKGFKISKVYANVHESYYPMPLSEKDCYVIYRKEHSEFNYSDRDVNVVSDGYISISPMSNNIFKEDDYNNLIKKIK